MRRLLFCGRYSVLLAGLSGCGPSHRDIVDAPIQVSFADLADRFSVSRTHVRKMVKEAEKRSLLLYSETTTITLAPSLVAAYDRFVADTMSGPDIMFKMATR